MAEISLLTASLALLSALGAFLWNHRVSIRVERGAEDLGQIQASLDGLASGVRDLNAQLPESRVIEVEATCRALKEQYDAMVNAFEAHRGQCHRTMQRFDQIMRRDERAAAVIQEAQAADVGLAVPEDDDAEAALSQEGDRTFLGRDGPAGGQPNNQAPATWEDRRRAMAAEYYGRRGGRAPIRR